MGKPRAYLKKRNSREKNKTNEQNIGKVETTITIQRKDDQDQLNCWF
jgi:hypothetical protein